MLPSCVVNNINIVFLVRARDQGAILVLVLMTCRPIHSIFFFFQFYLVKLSWKFFGPRVIYCFLYLKVVSNYCHREVKSEFAELRRKFRTIVLDAKDRS